MLPQPFPRRRSYRTPEFSRVTGHQSTEPVRRIAQVDANDSKLLPCIGRLSHILTLASARSDEVSGCSPAANLSGISSIIDGGA